MKVVEWLIYFTIFNSVLWFFTQIGVYSAAASLGISQQEWAIANVQSFVGLTGFTGIATLGLGLLTFVVAIKSGVNPFLSLAYGIMTGLFLNMWIKVFAVMNNIGTVMGDQSGVMTAFIVILGTVFALEMLYTLVQMATGGGKAYE